MATAALSLPRCFSTSELMGIRADLTAGVGRSWSVGIAPLGARGRYPLAGPVASGPVVAVKALLLLRRDLCQVERVVEAAQPSHGKGSSVAFVFFIAVLIGFFTAPR